MWGKKRGNMATGKFRLKGNGDLKSIYYRVKIGRSYDFEIVLKGYKCPKDRWSVSRQQILSNSIVDYVSINAMLNNLNSHILNLINSDFNDSIKYTNQWLKTEVYNFLEKSSSLETEDYKLFVVDFFQFYKEEILPKEKGKDGLNSLTTQTLKNFNSAIQAFEKFESKMAYKHRFKDFDDEALETYKIYLYNELLLSPSTVNKYCKTLLSVLNKAKELGYSNLILKFNKIKEQQKVEDYTYLTFNEIDKLFSHDFVGYLDNARDWLVLGCETGLRVSDLLNLTVSNLAKDDTIRLTTKKTKEHVTIPMSNNVKKIIAKNSGFPRKISSQKFNDYIKKVCELAEINDVIKGAKQEYVTLDSGKKVIRVKEMTLPKFNFISSHSCRRSFATNYYKSGNVPKHVIMAITGHKTESSFMKYIRMTNSEKVNEFKDAMTLIGR